MSGKRVLKIELLGDAKDASKAFGKVDKDASSLTETLGSVAGALGGAILTGHIEDTTVSMGKLRAQLGLTKEETDALGDVARTVYKDNFGESIGEATRVTGLMTQATGLTGDALAEVTEDVFRITDAFSELGAEPDIIAENVRVMTAAFPDKSEAEILDLIAKGFQDGAGRSGDLQDSLQEYPRFFSEIGLSGEDMINFMSTGMEAGARNSDLLGDAIKEMGIIVQETGSDGQAAIADMFGADQAEVLISNFAAGGEAGREAFFTILEGLNEIEDPLERNKKAVELFGTKGEDLAGVMEEMLPAFLATKDATGELGDVTGTLDAQYVGMGSTLEGYKRQFESAIIGPLGGVAAPAQEAITAFGGVATGLAGLNAMGIPVTETISKMGGKLLAAISPTNLVTAAQWAYNAALAANPIGLVVLALAALVGGLILAYTQSETFRNIVNGAWSAVYDHVQPILAWFTDTLVPFFTDTIPEKFAEFRSMTVGEIAGLAVDMLTKAPEVIGNLILGLGGLLLDAAGGALHLWTQFHLMVGTKLVELGAYLLAEGPTIVGNLVTGLATLVQDGIGGGLSLWVRMNELIGTKLLELGTALLTDYGPKIVGKIVSGLADLVSLDTAKGAVGQWVAFNTAVNKKVGEIISNAAGWGLGIARDFISGLVGKLTSSEALTQVFDAAWDLAGKALDGATEKLKIWSPSEEGRLIGEYFYKGIIKGMEEGQSEVYRWGWTLGDNAIQGSQDAWDGYGQTWWNGTWVAPPSAYDGWYKWGWALGETAADGAEDGFEETFDPPESPPPPEPPPSSNDSGSSSSGNSGSSPSGNSGSGGGSTGVGLGLNPDEATYMSSIPTQHFKQYLNVYAHFTKIIDDFLTDCVKEKYGRDIPLHGLSVQAWMTQFLDYVQSFAPIRENALAFVLDFLGPGYEHLARTFTAEYNEIIATANQDVNFSAGGGADTSAVSGGSYSGTNSSYSYSTSGPNAGELVPTNGTGSGIGGGGTSIVVNVGNENLVSAILDEPWAGMSQTVEV